MRRIELVTNKVTKSLKNQEIAGIIAKRKTRIAKSDLTALSQNARFAP
jgi:hypothetical protein